MLLFKRTVHEKTGATYITRDQTWTPTCVCLRHGLWGFSNFMQSCRRWNRLGLGVGANYVFKQEQPFQLHPVFYENSLLDGSWLKLEVEYCSNIFLVEARVNMKHFYLYYLIQKICEENNGRFVWPVWGYSRMSHSLVFFFTSCVTLPLITWDSHSHTVDMLSIIFQANHPANRFKPRRSYIISGAKGIQSQMNSKYKK